MTLADTSPGDFAVVATAIVAAVASIVVGYWNTHRARSSAEQAKEHTANADQKASYAATVSLSTRARVDEQQVSADVVGSFRDTIANMAAAQADLQRQTNAQLVACLESEARLTESNNLLTLAVAEQKTEIGALRTELETVRGRFEDFLLESREREP